MSSDSDVPLSRLARGKELRPSQDDDEDESSSEEEAEFESDDDRDDDDEDFAGEDSDDDGGGESGDSDSDDDVPLSRLKSPGKKKKAAPAKKKAPAKKAPAKKKTPAKKKVDTKAKKKKTTKTAATKKKVVSNGKRSSSGPTLASAELYASCDKGKLIQQLLCRWWYAMTWPDPSTLPPSIPKKYDSLDGFPGVYVCTEGENVGVIKDLRDKSTAPTFRNFAKKSSEELVGLLVKAIKVQRGQLVEAEGSGTDTEKGLKDLDKWARKLNCSKADRDAERVLKAAKVKL